MPELTGVSNRFAGLRPFRAYLMRAVQSHPQHGTVFMDKWRIYSERHPTTSGDYVFVLLEECDGADYQEAYDGVLRTVRSNAKWSKTYASVLHDLATPDRPRYQRIIPGTSSEAIEVSEPAPEIKKKSAARTRSLLKKKAVLDV